MSDEFPEVDTDTPTEHDLDVAYGSKFLSSADIGDRKIRTKIAKVGKEYLRNENGKPPRMKFVVFFQNVDKPMVLNATNKDTLVFSLGRTPANWKGADVGIYVDPNVTYAGRRVKGLRLRVLSPAVAPKPAAALAASKPWPDEPGDPGFEPESFT